MAWEHDLKKIYEREWKFIQSNWISNIPHIENAGQAPLNRINDLIDLDDFFKKCKDNNGSFNSDENQLRSEILWEAIFYAHKSIHIIVGAISHLDNGILSWGNSSAYQSSFYSIKSILAFCGLSFARVNNKTLVIDCYPELEKLSSRERKLNISPKLDMKFIIFDDLSHMQYWEIFQRVIRVLDCEFISKDLKKIINTIRSKDFVQERNSLHYICNYWPPNNDLFSFVFDKNYGVKVNLLNKLDEISIDDKDFSFFLNYLLLNLNLNMIKSISQFSTLIREEYKLMINTLDQISHNRLNSSLALY